MTVFNSYHDWEAHVVNENDSVTFSNPNPSVQMILAFDDSGYVLGSFDLLNSTGTCYKQSYREWIDTLTGDYTLRHLGVISIAESDDKENKFIGYFNHCFNSNCKIKESGLSFL